MNYFKNLKINKLNNLIIFNLIKIIIFFQKIKFYFSNLNNLSESKIIKRYKNFITKNLFEKTYLSKKIILMDTANIPNYIISNLILTSELKKLLKTDIFTFDFFDRKKNLDNIFDTLQINHLLISLNKEEKVNFEKYFLKSISKINSKNDLYKLKIKNVSVGIEIYETILKNGNPTVSYGTFEMYYRIYQGLYCFFYFEKLFKKKLISALCLSDNTYITTGIPIKLAYKYSIPVFHATPIDLNRTEKEYQLHSRFYKYRKYFDYLSKSQKKLAINNSKKLLSKRLAGKTKIKMFYQEKSAFTKNLIKRQLKQNDKIKIILTTHCFFDNPSAYGKFLFKDFYDWLVFVGKIGEKIKNKYEIYIKPHRDYLPGTLETLNAIKRKFTNLEIIDPETTFHQLKSEGAKIILTGYGSVGHELPLLDFLVINAGYNPHINFSFNIHPKSQKNYRSILNNLAAQKVNVIKDEIYTFFYIHYTFNNNDDFLFDSYEEYCRYVNFKMKSEKCYEFFLKNGTKYLKKYKNLINDSLKSNRCFSIERNLKKKYQKKLIKTNLSKII